MVRAAARIFVSLWLLAGLRAVAAEPAQTATGALDITLKAAEVPGAPAGETVKLYSASKALVIGIDNYSAGWPTLSGAVKDAKAVAEALKLQGFEVTLVADPASAALRQAFEDFSASVSFAAVRGATIRRTSGAWRGDSSPGDRVNRFGLRVARRLNP